MILKWLWLGKFLQTVKDAKSTEAFPASPRRREMALHLHFPFYDVQVGNFFWKSYHFHFHSIVSLVAVIYCIVIIYLPSLVEADTNFVVNIHLFFFITIEDFFDKCLFLQGPKRCTTTVIERNITNAFQVKSSGDSSYHRDPKSKSRSLLTPRVTHSAPGPLAQSGVSVRWRKMILIQFSSNLKFWFQLGMMTCSKMYGMVRDPGVSLSLEQVALTHIWKKMKMFQCDLEEGGGFMFHTCYNEEDLEPYNCKRSQFEISVSGKRQILFFSEKRFEFLPQDPGDIETCHQFSNLISCKVAWDLFAAPNFWIKSENNWRSMFDRWDFAKTYRRSGSASTKTGMDWPEIGKS